MDPRSNWIQPSLALMATLTSGLLGQSDTRPWQPSSAVWALGHGSHLTPVGPRPTGLLLSGLATQSPVVAPFGPSNPSRTLTPVDPNNRASSSPDPTPVLTDHAHSDPHPPVPSRTLQHPRTLLTPHPPSAAAWPPGFCHATSVLLSILRSGPQALLVLRSLCPPFVWGSPFVL